MKKTASQKLVAKPGPPRQILLRVTMRGISPPIWRSLLVPDAFTLHRLHRVFQIVFSKLDYHLYEFRIGDRRFQAPDPEADEVSENTVRTTLRSLDLQPGSHLMYLYDFGDGWEHDVIVEQLLPVPHPDAFDGFPHLVDGARAAPPEDAGSIPGYENLIAVLSNPRHPDYKELRGWAGEKYDPECFDAWALDHALVLAVAWGAI